MPTTLDGFLASDRLLAALRRDGDVVGEKALIVMLTAHWNNGMIGWMTDEEAAALARELNADATEKRVNGWATVHPGYLVFAGGRDGEHWLPLFVTSPVRARKIWPGYLGTCPPLRPTTMLGRLAEQLGLGSWRVPGGER